MICKRGSDWQEGPSRSGLVATSKSMKDVTEETLYLELSLACLRIITHISLQAPIKIVIMKSNYCIRSYSEFQLLCIDSASFFHCFIFKEILLFSFQNFCRKVTSVVTPILRKPGRVPAIGKSILILKAEA